MSWSISSDTKLISSAPGFNSRTNQLHAFPSRIQYTLFWLNVYNITIPVLLSFQNHCLQGANQAATAQQGSFFLNPRYKSIIIVNPLYRCIGQDTLPSLKSCELLTYVLFHCHKLFRIQISTAAHGSRCDDM
jgi:hypothetical protein